MTAKEFVIWLEGYLQGNGDVGLTTMQVRDLINKMSEIDLTEEKKNLIIEKVSAPTNPIRIGDESKGYDFPGKPNQVYM